MSSFPVGGTASSMKSPVHFELDLPEYDSNGDWDFLNNANQTRKVDFDSFSDLFEVEENNVKMPVEEASQQDGTLFQAYAADEILQINTSYSQAMTQQASPASVDALDRLLQNSEDSTSFQQSRQETAPQFGGGAHTISSMQGLPDHVHNGVTEQRISNSNGGATGDNFSSPPRVFDSGRPPAAVSFAALQTTRARPTTFLPSQSDTLFDAYNGPDNFDGSQSLSVRVPTINADTDAPNELALQSTQTASPSNPTTPSQTDWEPFTDVRQGRIWVFGGENGHSQASRQDKTLPRTPAQRRLVADRLRAAFESAQPPKSKHEFLLLDWSCLEIVDEVSLAHAYGPLTKRYLSGRPKLEPAQYEKYSDHIDDLIAVIGRQDCPKAKSLRKRMMDVTHRKRLIDNPWGELGIVAKNGDANKARRLRDEERKAKAAALQRENALLKAQLEGRSPAATPGLQQTNQGKSSKTSKPTLITPRRPSSKLSFAQQSTEIQQPFGILSYGSEFTVDNSSTSFGEQPSPIFLDFDEDGHEPTFHDTNGPSAPKKARYTAHSSMAGRETPNPKARAFDASTTEIWPYPSW